MVMLMPILISGKKYPSPALKARQLRTQTKTKRRTLLLGKTMMILSGWTRPSTFSMTSGLDSNGNSDSNSDSNVVSQCTA